MENYWSPEAIEARVNENKTKLGLNPVIKPIGTNIGGGTTGATTVTSGETENAFITEALTPSFDESVWSQDFTKKNPLLTAAESEFPIEEEEEEEEESSEYGRQADGSFIPYPVDEGIGSEETKIKETDATLDDESNVLDYWKNKDFRNLKTAEIREEDNPLKLEKVKSAIGSEEYLPDEDEDEEDDDDIDEDTEEDDDKAKGPNVKAMGQGFIDMGKTIAEGGYDYGDIF